MKEIAAIALIAADVRQRSVMTVITTVIALRKI